MGNTLTFYADPNTEAELNMLILHESEKSGFSGKSFHAHHQADRR